MKRLIIVIILFLSLGIIQAQDYQTSIGIRSGYSNGINVKHFVSQNYAFEAILATQYGGLILTGLYEFNNEFRDSDLNWYYGFGAHLAYFKGNRNAYPYWWGMNRTNAYTILGADAIIGIEYTFHETPISLSLDWKPSFNLFGHSGFLEDNFAFSIRYIIKQ